MRVLVATAVPAERDAVARAFGDPASEHPLHGTALTILRCGAADVVAAGVGPAAAAAGAAIALTVAALEGRPYGLVVSAGIGGGFTGRAPLGSVVVADAIVAADLGAETPEGFVTVTGLGFGTDRHVPPPALVRETADATSALTGTVLTVSTATGSAARTAELLSTHPEAAAEAMEGFGVAEAAAAHGVPALEVRAVSNAVGPRDRESWRIGEALAALTDAFAKLLAPGGSWSDTPRIRT
ncbi:futalosine hydrolase [Streptomyces tsukubensis]|uniref:Futalosine hydrolase n=1 Tax=Streptomyces tsukubensis TaxID=83656 RepID=A0A1V4A0G8_9ACTN|nr:futalosine hydrolase [Streptomyces tsukubensis]OON72315.1 futalosine hydrolase [Streptomyces tsukubensis]QFR94182.1 futalosine hydrolase [Streptomyces tsukubensis]